MAGKIFLPPAPLVALVLSAAAVVGNASAFCVRVAARPSPPRMRPSFVVSPSPPHPRLASTRYGYGPASDRRALPHLHAVKGGGGGGGGFGKKAPPTPEQQAKIDAEQSKLFQALLRDLQIENVPLLGCDADQVATYMAATWTTMAELSDKDDEDKVCLVLEKIPLDAVNAFVQDFTILKMQDRLMDHLPELARISVSVIGKGAGPALVIETTARTEEELAERATRLADEGSVDRGRSEGALRSFVDRMVVGESACPYTKASDVAPAGLEAKGVQPAPVGYRFGGSSDACSALATFWTTCICELMSLPEDELSTVVLSLPAIGRGTTREAHDRFAAVVELISRNLCLFRGDSSFGLVHFHPAYDRTIIDPVNKPAYGHLPPRGWLRAMLRMNGNEQEAEGLSDEELNLSDYQRRSPHTAINVLRASQISAAAGGKSIVDLELDDGTTEKASGISTYSRNALRLAEMGKDVLEEAAQKELAMETA